MANDARIGILFQILRDHISVDILSGVLKLPQIMSQELLASLLYMNEDLQLASKLMRGFKGKQAYKHVRKCHEI